MSDPPEPHYRGDDFSYSFSLTGGWLASQLSSVKVTFRTAIPASSVVTDDDSGVVDKASVATGEITFDGPGVVATIAIPNARCNVWPTGRLYWDCQVVVTSTGIKRTTDSGTIVILGDVTRS